jgi:hypothetical protein
MVYEPDGLISSAFAVSIVRLIRAGYLKHLDIIPTAKMDEFPAT